ncbi:MAG: hypothetical protein IJZ72_05405 [Oscillospiraceae bacterium]|nr:hypothetical protein [Oscillospiraceae bacterium]
MKYIKKILAVLLTATLVSGCASENETTSETVQTTATTAETTVVTTTAVPETTVTTKTTTETTAAETTTVTSAETEKHVSVTEPAEAELKPLDERTAFVDYRFEEAVETEITEDINERAITAVMESDFYHVSRTHAAELKEEFEKEKQSLKLWCEENGKDFEASVYNADYFDEKGNVIPVVYAAYTYDYDCNGRDETFAVVNMPYFAYTDNYCIRSIIVFISDGYYDEIIDDYSNLEPVYMLDYGYCRQIIFKGYGVMGADDHTCIYGVINGNPKQLYANRCGYEKTGFLLGTFGWQGTGSTMYFDNVKMEYVNVGMEFVPVDEVRAMDEKGTITDRIDECVEHSGDLFRIYRLGKRFYCFSLGGYDMGEVYDFKDGGFINVTEEMPALRYSYDMAVYDIDFNTAFDEMLSPEQAAERVITVNGSGIPLALYTEVSDGNVFVDFTMEQMQENTNVSTFIKNKAVEYFKDSRYYVDYTDEQIKQLKGYLDNYKEFINENGELSDLDKSYFEEYFSEDGTIEPKIYKVYSVKLSSIYDDMNHIAVVNTPYLLGNKSPCLRNFVLYLDDDGRLIKILDNFSNFEEPVLLDYGNEKQVVLSGSGIAGVDDHTAIYSLGIFEFSTNKLYSGRCSFAKDGCLLGVYGWQGSGGTMYYDTVAQEYRYIIGETLDIETVKSMDTHGDMAEFIEQWENGELCIVTLIGGKYYSFSYGPMDSGKVYIYEDGRFVVAGNIAVRFTSESEYNEFKMVKDIDLEKAYAEMVSPEELK